MKILVIGLLMLSGCKSFQHKADFPVSLDEVLPLSPTVDCYMGGQYASETKDYCSQLIAVNAAYCKTHACTLTYHHLPHKLSEYKKDTYIYLPDCLDPENPQCHIEESAFEIDCTPGFEHPAGNKYECVAVAPNEKLIKDVQKAEPK